MNDIAKNLTAQQEAGQTLPVQLAITLHLPPECREYSREELLQLIFDEYINYATMSHLQDASKWGSYAKIGSDQEDPSKKAVYGHHVLWGEICDRAAWDLDVPAKP